MLAHGWNATCYQVLNPGIAHWFDPAGDAVVGFARFGRTRVVVGAPVCAEGRLDHVARAFEADAADSGERVLFFSAGARLERIYAMRANHCLVPLGAQPSWDPREWDEVVRTKASLRAQLRRAANKGVRVRRLMIDTDGALRVDALLRATGGPDQRVADGPDRRVAGGPDLRLALRAVLDEWLAGRGLPPLRFMTYADLIDQLTDRRVYLAESEGDPVGFLLSTPVPAQSGWLIEQWPRTAAAPNGTTHLLVDAAMRDAAASGAGFVSLGLSPLSRRGDPAGHEPPRWVRPVLAWIRAHGRRFYNFDGLEGFKASLQPAAWTPVFAIAQGRRFTPSMLRAIAGVFSGGSPEWFVARALAQAAKQEMAGGRRR
ncbi:MAG: phosphatidylglycerol lysyltransferase domain-containing protein [Gemmatimonadaceae bacterium]